MLEVADLSVCFENVQPLHGLGFSVARGASLAVIGPNGAGKTVLFRAIIGATPFVVLFAGPGTRESAMFRRSWISIVTFRSPRSIFWRHGKP